MGNLNEAPFTVELELAIFGILVLGFGKPLLKAHTMPSFANSLALNRLSKCKAAMLKVRIEEGLVLNRGELMACQRMLESLLLGVGIHKSMA